jgi:DNA-directed RNA polymerase specialized sigma24 family protein
MMRHEEPSPDWQSDIYQRIITRDPIAFPQLCEEALPHLVNTLKRENPQVDDHLVETVVHDLLMSFDAHPQVYDHSKATLFTYFRMAARDDLKNALDKQQRREQRLIELDQHSVELNASSRYIEQEYFDVADWLKEFTDRSPKDVIAELLKEFDPVEQRALQLMLEGVRDTAQYAEILDIADLDNASQTREVKRLKDRIKKRIQRFGDRMRGNE